MQHLFDEWPCVRAALKAAPRWLVMLDFDGTLAPIVEYAGDAVLPAAAEQHLRKLAASPAIDLAIVSGRAIADLHPRIGVDGIDFSGNHGRERLKPGSSRTELDSSVRVIVAQVCEQVRKEVSGISGVYVEDKGLTTSLHYRQVPAEFHAKVRDVVREVERTFGAAIELAEGKCVFDFFPADGANKGKAVMALLAERGGAAKVLPIYCGDDTTDETVFRVLPLQAITVYVGSGETESAARFRVDDTAEVAEFLGRMGSLREQFHTSGVEPVPGR